MASNNREIAIVIRADNMADSEITEAQSKIEGMGYKVTAVGKKTEDMGRIGRLSMWSFGESVGSLAEEFGISSRAGNRFGDAVADIAGKYGGFAMALGGVSLALGAGIMIWQHFTASKAKAREELDKMIDSLEKEINALSGGNAYKSDQTIRIERDLLEKKREYLALKMPEKIEDEKQKLKDMNKELQTGGSFLDVMARGYKAWGQSMKNMWTGEGSSNMGVLAGEAKAKGDVELQIGADIKALEIQREKQRIVDLKELHNQEIAAVVMKQDTLAASYTDYYNRLQMLDAERTRKEEENFFLRDGMAELETYNDQARGRIKEAVYQSTEKQLLRLVEAHKFSVSAIGKAITQQIKMELIGLAARAAVYSIFYLAYGLGLTAMGDPRAAAAFAAAAEFGTVAGISLAAAAAVNAAVGPGAQRGEAGSPTGLPVNTSQAAPESAQGSSNAVTHVTINVHNPLSSQNWDEIMELDIIPAINRAGERGVAMA